MGVPVWLLALDFEPRGRSLYTLRLAERLPEHGFDPIILCSSASAIPTKLRDKLVVREEPYLTRPFFQHFVLRRLAKEYASNPPALIHAQRRALYRQAARLADYLSLPFLVTIHHVLSSVSALGAITNRLAGVLAISPSIQKDLLLKGVVPSEMIHIIPAGVDYTDQAVLEPPRDIDRVPIVCTAGALEPYKGLMYFLMAAEIILSSGQDAEFIITGTGPEEETLRRVAQHLDIANRVTFVNHTKEYRPIIEMADIFVVTSLEQGLGTLMLEAMAAGRPVVATRVGGIADYLSDGDHALLVPTADPVMLAEKIQYLIDNPIRARKLAVNGQQFVRNEFSVDKMAAKTAEFYRNVLKQEADRNVVTLPMKTEG